ncbi:MAG TPA: metal-dependent transcriptional regulator [Actinomycetota bacterium]|nr:metal-dependent transcriptional regulator [Actinomycetota bacterium]
MRGVEDYLGQVKRLEEDATRCTATVLARTLHVSLPSASEMLKRLSAEGYVERTKDGSVLLTADGRVQATRNLRRHRLVERLLTSILGMPWHEVHEEAHRLEHAVSARVEERLAQTLGFPEYCPHGLPICPVDPRELRALNDEVVGDAVAVAQVSEVSGELPGFLHETGMSPGALIKVIDAAPFGGPFTIETSAGRVSIGREVAALVRVCSPEDAELIHGRAV